MTKKNVPSLRYKKFTDPWEQLNLYEVANHRGGTAIEKYFEKDGKYKVISIGSYGLDSKYVDQNIRAVSNEVTDGRVVHAGELTMVLNDKTANGTIIGRSLLIEQDNEYVINQRTEIISPKENFNSDFAYTILNGPFRERVKRIVQGGTQIYVNYPAVSNLNVDIPNIEEQQKIGNFFKQLDNTIALHQRKLYRLKQIKKSLLQQVFPQKGSSTPQLRLGNFSDNWKQNRLGNLVVPIKSYSLSRDVESVKDTGYKYIHYGDIHTKVADRIDELSEIPNIKPGNYELLRKGDLVVADASEDYQGIATPSVVTIDTPYKLVAGLHTIALRPINADSLFLYYLIYSPAFREYGYRIGTGMKVFGISTTNLLNFESMIPSLEEQIEIGNFFKQLDQTIIAQQRRYEKFKQIKTALLQEMFV